MSRFLTLFPGSIVIFLLLQTFPSLSFAQAVCGDAVCSQEETCESCHADCGFCTPLLVPLRTQELGVCGNAVCTVDEDCRTCEADCGKCPSYLGIVRESATQLQTLLSAPENSTLGQRFSLKELQHLEELRHAEKLDIWTNFHITRIVEAIQRAIAEETELLSENLLSMLQNNVLRERWSILNARSITEVLKKKNVQALLPLLPPSPRDLQSLSQELNTFSRLFEEETPPSWIHRFLEKAFAAEEKKNGIDPKERLSVAVTLLKRLGDMKRDPKETLPALEEHFTSLLAEKDVLADDIGRELRTMQKDMRHPSSETTLDLLQKMQVLNERANFQAIGTSFARGVRDMRSHWWSASPHGRAVTVLEKGGEQRVADVLAGKDIAEQKETLTLFLAGEQDLFEQFLQTLPESSQEGFSIRMKSLETMLQKAETTADTRIVLEGWSDIAKDLQSAVRAEKGVLLRFIYALQDFFNQT